MKYTVILAAVVAVTTAHSIADLPSCSLDCLSNAVKGLGCDLTDFACSCKKAEQLTSAITSSLKKDCTKEADQEKVASVLEFLCKGVGVDINAPAGNTATPGPSSAAQPVLATSKPAGTPIAPPTTPTTPPAPPKGPSESECVPVTVTVTATLAPGQSPPYPVPSGASSGLMPSGTGRVNASMPQFTAGAAAAKVPLFAGVIGLAALVL